MSDIPSYATGAGFTVPPGSGGGGGGITPPAGDIGGTTTDPTVVGIQGVEFANIPTDTIFEIPVYVPTAGGGPLVEWAPFSAFILSTTGTVLNTTSAGQANLSVVYTGSFLTPTTPPLSGTSYQVSGNRPWHIYETFTYAAAAASSINLQISPDNTTFTQVMQKSVPATSVGGTDSMSAIVPPGWWYRFLATGGATLGTLAAILS